MHFGSVQQFTAEELTTAQKYVEETLRSRTWVTYMLASYLPQPVRPAFYAIHLFDMELTKISENAREPSLGKAWVIQLRESSIFGKRRYIGSTREKSHNNSRCVSVCTTQ